MEMERGKKGKLDTMKRKSLKEDQNKKEEESVLLYGMRSGSVYRILYNKYLGICLVLATIEGATVHIYVHLVPL